MTPTSNVIPFHYTNSLDLVRSFILYLIYCFRCFYFSFQKRLLHSFLFLHSSRESLYTSFFFCVTKELYIKIQFWTRRNFNLMQWSINWKKKRMERKLRNRWTKSHSNHTHRKKRKKTSQTNKQANSEMRPNKV